MCKISRIWSSRRTRACESYRTDRPWPTASPMRTPSERHGASPSARTPLDEDEDAGGKNKPRRISVMLSNVIPGLGNAVSDKTLRELDSALDAVTHVPR